MLPNGSTGAGKLYAAPLVGVALDEVAIVGVVTR